MTANVIAVAAQKGERGGGDPARQLCPCPPLPAPHRGDGIVADSNIFHSTSSLLPTRLYRIAADVVTTVLYLHFDRYSCVLPKS